MILRLKCIYSYKMVNIKRRAQKMLKVLMGIVCVAIIVLSLLQSGKSEGLVSALTGQNSNLFSQSKERGPEVVLSRITLGLAIAFFVLAIMIRIG